MNEGWRHASPLHPLACDAGAAPATSHCPMRCAIIADKDGLMNAASRRAPASRKGGSSCNRTCALDEQARVPVWRSPQRRHAVEPRRGGRADLRLRHAAARHAQPHHRLRHRQGAEGEGRHEHAGAADRRRNRDHSRWSRAARSRSASPTCWRCRTASRPARLQNDLRIIGSIHALRIGFFVRKDCGITTVADLKGKRVPAGYSAMRKLDKTSLRHACDRRPDRAPTSSP